MERAILQAANRPWAQHKHGSCVKHGVCVQHGFCVKQLFVEKALLRQTHLFKPQVKFKPKHVCKPGFWKRPYWERFWDRQYLERLWLCVSKVFGTKASGSSFRYKKRSKPMANHNKKRKQWSKWTKPVLSEAWAGLGPAQSNERYRRATEELGGRRGVGSS